MTSATAPLPPAQAAGPGAIMVAPYTSADETAWADFLAGSGNATLFHDLRFLAYHPPGRFDTHHLLFRRGPSLVALLPAAIITEPDGRRLLKSPYGGSVGGCALRPREHIETIQAIVQGLQEYAVACGLAGVELRIGPGIYAQPPNENMSFALAAAGFVLARRWLSQVITLPGDAAAVVDGIPTPVRRRYVRYAQRQGVAFAQVGPERLPDFDALLTANRAKHGAVPTHALADLQRIFELTPERVGLFLCEYQRRPIGGAYLLELNPRVVYWSYLCHDERFEHTRVTTFTTARVMEHYAARGFKYLDFGPSTFDDWSLNRGLAKFKEELGGVGFCRDTWRWEVTFPAPRPDGRTNA